MREGSKASHQSLTSSEQTSSRTLIWFVGSGTLSCYAKNDAKIDVVAMWNARCSLKFCGASP